MGRRISLHGREAHRNYLYRLARTGTAIFTAYRVVQEERGYGMVFDFVLRVLMIDDEDSDAWLTEDALQQFGYTIVAQRVDTAETLNAALIEQAWDLIVCDYQMLSLSGLDALAITRRHGIDLPFILLSGTVGEEFAVEAMRAGADDYIMKGNLARLVPSVQRALRDVTERRRRRQAEELLHASDARYRSLVELSPDAIVLHDLHGVIQMANQQTAVLYHSASPEALIGRNALELVVPADRERAMAALRAVAGGAESGTLAYTALRHDGTTFALELQATRVDAVESDGMDSVMIVARDVTVLREAEAARIASEVRYRLIVETAHEGIWQLDAQLNIVFVNQSMALMLGYRVEEMLGTPAASFIDEEDPSVKATRVQMRREGSRELIDVRMRHKDGSVVWGLAKGQALAEADGTFAGILAMVTDITARKAAEDARIASEARYRLIVETACEGIWLLDAEGIIEFVNPTMAAMLGYTAAEMLGMSAAGVVDDADSSVAEARNQARRAGSTELFEVPFRHKNGSRLWVLASARIIHDADGTATGVLAMVTDITARKEAEAARIASEARYRLIVETANEGIWQTDHQMVVIFVNQAMAAMLGYTVDEMLGASTARFVADLDLPARAAMIQARRAGSTELFEVPFRHKDGSRLCLLASGRSIQEADGTDGGILTMFTDITSRKEAEARLIAERDLLGTLMDAVPDAMYIKDTQSRFLRVNAAQARSLGAATPEAVVGKTDLDFYPRVLAERFIEQERHVLASGDPVINDLEDQSSRSLSKRWILSSMSPVRQGGRITGLVGISRDITAFKQAEEERQRFFELSLDLLCVATIDGYFKSVNPAFEARLGFTPGELCGEPFLNFVHPDDQAATLAVIATLADGTPASSFENRYRAKDGSYRWLLWTAVPVLTEGLLYATAQDITERKRMEERLHQQIGRISALHAIDTTIAASLDLRVTLGVALDQVCTQLGVDAAQVLLLDRYLLTLEPAAERGFRTSQVGGPRLRLGEGHAGRAALEQRLIAVPDLRCEEVIRTSLMVVEGFTAYAAAPLVARGQVLGVLEVFHRSLLAQDSDWLEFLLTLASQVAIAVDNAALFKDLQQSNTGLVLAYDTTIEGWSRALDLRDKETEGHTQRVTKQTLLLAQAMGVHSAELVQMRRGALLHDIGKMGIPDAILLKPGPLSEEEWVLMRKHPAYAYELLSPIAYLRPALDIPYCHHEKWDGAGYPRGLAGEHIPLAARIFAVIDVADALRSNRPYRAGWQPDRVRAHIASLSGSHFDPAVVAVFLSRIDDEMHQIAAIT